jgi:hypothetical protein
MVLDMNVNFPPAFGVPAEPVVSGDVLPGAALAAVVLCGVVAAVPPLLPAVVAADAAGAVLAVVPAVVPELFLSLEHAPTMSAHATAVPTMPAKRRPARLLPAGATRRFL